MIGARRVIDLGEASATLEAVEAVSAGAAVALHPALRRRVDASHQLLCRCLAEGRALYGVRTGYGASVVREVPARLVDDLPARLVAYHGCGVGPALAEGEAAAVVFCRLVTLSRGYSGVRWELLEALAALLHHRIVPVIPSLGSVGASGDLTPLSYVAAVLMGQREVDHGGQRLGAGEALAGAGIAPLTLGPKEGLALMNGTSVMSALGALAWVRARRVTWQAARISALACYAARASGGHFRRELFALKPHPGQGLVASWLADDLAGATTPAPRLQVPYSLRCAPHVIGVLADALRLGRGVLETELNGVDDNPVFDPETGDVYHGGHFYGGHVCHVLDGMKAAAAGVVDLLDRQVLLLCQSAGSGGLPENLSGHVGESGEVHHGFKAVQITLSALAAEALKRSTPASLFSRSTESHNQDKVSMGTHAAQDVLAILELAETALGLAFLAVAQAAELRGAGGAPPAIQESLRALRERVPAHREDRRMDLDVGPAREVLAALLPPLDDVLVG